MTDITYTNADGSAPREPSFADIFGLLDKWEKRLCDGTVKDNMKCTGLWLKLWGDGSGSVMAEWHDVRGDDPEDVACARMALTMAPTAVLEFESLAELHGALVQQTMRVRREK